MIAATIQRGVELEDILTPYESTGATTIKRILAVLWEEGESLKRLRPLIGHKLASIIHTFHGRKRTALRTVHQPIGTGIKPGLDSG